MCQPEPWRGAYHFKNTCSPITLANISSIKLVSIFRCFSPPTNPVYVRCVDPSSSVSSLSSHRHSYIGLLCSSRSSYRFIINKQTTKRTGEGWRIRLESQGIPGRIPVSYTTGSGVSPTRCGRWWGCWRRERNLGGHTREWTRLGNDWGWGCGFTRSTLGPDGMVTSLTDTNKDIHK